MWLAVRLAAASRNPTLKLGEVIAQRVLRTTTSCAFLNILNPDNTKWCPANFSVLTQKQKVRDMTHYYPSTLAKKILAKNNGDKGVACNK
jgi:hypothetical protein